MKIDVFNHIFPAPFFARLQAVTVNKGAIKRWLHIPFLHDVDVRFRMLEEFGDDYRQILSLSAPPIESINPDRQITIDLARLANDSQAELVRRYPDRFPGFIASLPLNHPEASVAELERAVGQLGALGVQIFSNVNGLPLDDERFFPLFETAAWAEVIEGLRALPPSPGLAGAAAHPCAAAAEPQTLVIAEVEAIWSAIDREDDWSPLAAKIARIRETGAMNAALGLLTGPNARPGHRPLAA